MQPLFAYSAMLELHQGGLNGIVCVHFWQPDADMYVQDAVKQKVKEAHDKATADHTVDKLVVWSGSSIGLVKNIQHAEDVVNKMVADVKLLFLKNAQLAA